MIGNRFVLVQFNDAIMNGIALWISKVRFARKRSYAHSGSDITRNKENMKKKEVRTMAR